MFAPLLLASVLLLAEGRDYPEKAVKAVRAVHSGWIRAVCACVHLTLSLIKPSTLTQKTPIHVPFADPTSICRLATAVLGVWGMVVVMVGILRCGARAS